MRNHFFTGKMMVAARLRRRAALPRRQDAPPPRAPARRGRRCAGSRSCRTPTPACRTRYVVRRRRARRSTAAATRSSSRRTSASTSRGHPGDRARCRRADDTRRTRCRSASRYRECPTEDVPVLYDECGCDDNAVRAEPHPRVVTTSTCWSTRRPYQRPSRAALRAISGGTISTAARRATRRTASCSPTIANYHLGDVLDDTRIDNKTGRTLLPSVQTLAELIECMQQQGGGGTGPQGPVGPQGPAGQPGPAGAQGPVGPQGPQGPQGSRGRKESKGLKACRERKDSPDPRGPPGPRGRPDPASRPGSRASSH